MLLALNGIAPIGIWTRKGVVFDGDPTSDEGVAVEPSVIYEGGAQILSGTVFKMWWVGGWNTPHVNYAESIDGINWAQYGSNPVIAASVNHPYVLKDGSTYYAYVVNGTDFDLYTSADGVSWSLDTSAVLSVGSGGSWDDNALGNIFVWKQDTNDWRAIYEARQSGTGWKLGYATASDPAGTWTKSISNPVVDESVSNGGPWIYEALDGTYWMIHHRSSDITLPTDIWKSSSLNLTSWTNNPTHPWYWRNNANEGQNTIVGQVADADLIEVNGKTYMFYSAQSDGTQASGSRGIALAVSRLPLEKLVLHSE